MIWHNPRPVSVDGKSESGTVFNQKSHPVKIHQIFLPYVKIGKKTDEISNVWAILGLSTNGQRYHRARITRFMFAVGLYSTEYRTHTWHGQLFRAYFAKLRKHAQSFILRKWRSSPLIKGYVGSTLFHGQIYTAEITIRHAFTTCIQ